MKKFRVEGIDISHLEVVKETEKQIVYISKSKHQYREAKNSQYAMWFDDFDSAKSYLIEKYENIVKRNRISLDISKENLHKIYNLKP